MCYDQVSAAPRTHTQINATVVVPGTGQGTLVIATTAQHSTTSLPISTTFSSRKTSFPFSNILSSSSPVISATTVTPTTSAQIEITGAPETDSAKDNDDQSEPKKLGPGQIIGIAVGSAVGLGLLIVVFLWAHKRRKMLLQDEFPSYNGKQASTSFFSFMKKRWRKSSDTDIGFGPPLSQGMAASGRSFGPNILPGANIQTQGCVTSKVIARQKKHPFPLKPINESPPEDSLQVASGLTSAAIATRSPAKPKPALTLAIPAVGSSSSTENDRGPIAPSRPNRATGQSSLLVTPFEEDGEDYHNRSEPASATQIWRPPSVGPHSANTYYVADKNGNWVLKDFNEPIRKSMAVELEAPSLMTKSPFKKREEVYESFWRRVSQTRKGAQSQSQTSDLQLNRDPDGNDVATGSSSIYSQDTAQLQTQFKEQSERAATNESNARTQFCIQTSHMPNFSAPISERLGPRQSFWYQYRKNATASSSSASASAISTSERLGWFNMASSGSTLPSRPDPQPQASTGQSIWALQNREETGPATITELSPVTESPDLSQKKSPTTEPLRLHSQTSKAKESGFKSMASSSTIRIVNNDLQTPSNQIIHSSNNYRQKFNNENAQDERVVYPVALNPYRAAAWDIAPQSAHNTRSLADRPNQQYLYSSRENFNLPQQLSDEAVQGRILPGRAQYQAQLSSSPRWHRLSQSDTLSSAKTFSPSNSISPLDNHSANLFKIIKAATSTPGSTFSTAVTSPPQKDESNLSPVNMQIDTIKSGPHQQHVAYFQSQISGSTRLNKSPTRTSSVTSSILAKRLGEEKAAQLSSHLEAGDIKRDSRGKWNSTVKSLEVGQHYQLSSVDAPLPLSNYSPQNSGSLTTARFLSPYSAHDLVSKESRSTFSDNSKANYYESIKIGARKQSQMIQKQEGGNWGTRKSGVGAKSNGFKGEMTHKSARITQKKSEMPQSPLWVPKLTPTRRGDDLYLNVH